MARVDTFTFRATEEERLLIEVIAKRLDRTQSDAMRWIVRELAKEMAQQPNTPQGKLHIELWI